jgi:hypothetical protein
MNFESFLLALVGIGIKMHENVDPRSLIHMELLLNAFHVKYYQEFTAKLQALGIKYSSSDFYHCYKDIFKKANHRRQASQDKISLFNNPHLAGEGKATSSQLRDSKVESQSSPKNIQSSNLLLKEHIIKERS